MGSSGKVTTAPLFGAWRKWLKGGGGPTLEPNMVEKKKKNKML